MITRAGSWMISWRNHLAQRRKETRHNNRQRSRRLDRGRRKPV